MAEEEDIGVPVEGVKNKKKLIIIIGGVVALLLVNVVAMVFIVKSMKPEAAPVEEAKPMVVAPTYIPLSPPFVVNFEDQSLVRFLQVTIEVMTRDPEVVAAVEHHMPRIRNSLVLLLSSQNYQTLSSVEGKRQIRKQALTEVQSILEEQIGKPGVEEIYFTSFVMQ